MERQVLGERQGAHQRLGELERDAGSAQILLRRWTIGTPRVEHGAGGWQLVARQVVIGDDDLDAGAARRAHGLDGGDAAVAGDDEARPHALGRGQAGGPKVIAVADAVRHERLDGGAGGAQQTRQHGGGALAVHVVVAVHEDRMSGAHRTHHEVQGDPHVRQEEGVHQAGELRPQECLCGRWSAVAALHQQRRERERNVQLRRERVCDCGIRRSGDGPASREWGHSAA